MCRCLGNRRLYDVPNASMRNARDNEIRDRTMGMVVACQFNVRLTHGAKDDSCDLADGLEFTTKSEEVEQLAFIGAEWQGELLSIIGLREPLEHCPTQFWEH